MTKLFVGIDIGTSGCKLALFDEMGEIKFQASESYPIYYPQAGHVEQNPNEWWFAVCNGFKNLWEQGAKPSQIVAIGIDGQSWSAIPVDSAGKVIANTPIWMDTRAADICKVWGERLGLEHIFSVSGNPFSPTYTLPKVLYWAEHQPDIIRNASYILQSNSYLAYLLTGEIAMDYSMAYGWQNFSQTALCFDAALSGAFGLPERFLTAPIPSHSVVGKVTNLAAKTTGLAVGTPVVLGGLDAACSSLGVGVVRMGQTQEQGGQAGGMSICLDYPVAHPDLILGAHVVPGAWLLQGGTVGGGASLKWFAEQIACQSNTPIPHDVFKGLSSLAETSPVGANGVIFVPYLSGERSPIWDHKAQGMYFGLRYSVTYADLVRATMEGVAYSLQHNIETAKEVGANVLELRGTGGSANSHIWTQIKSDVTGLPMVIPASDTATTCGAAMLAMVGTGVYPSCEDASAKIVKIKRTHAPNNSNAKTYHDMYELYVNLYHSTSESMHRLFDMQSH